VLGITLASYRVAQIAAGPVSSYAVLVEHLDNRVAQVIDFVWPILPGPTQVPSSRWRFTHPTHCLHVPSAHKTPLDSVKRLLAHLVHCTVSFRIRPSSCSFVDPKIDLGQG